MTKMIDRSKRNKTLSKANRKNLQTFLEISTVQKAVLPSRKLQDHAREY